MSFLIVILMPLQNNNTLSIKHIVFEFITQIIIIIIRIKSNQNEFMKFKK